MIVTSSKRRTDDYHELLSEVEDPIEYLSEKGHVPGQWIGQGAGPSGLEGEVTKEAFIHRTFGFRQRTMTPTERERGVDPAVEAWAKVKLEQWKVRKIEERIALRERKIARINPNDEKKAKREEKKLRAEIDSIRQEREDILARYGSPQALKTAEANAKKEAMKVLAPVNPTGNADPVGYTAAMMKFRHAELTEERDAAKASGNKRETERLERMLSELDERAAVFFAQSKEIQDFRKDADQFRIEAKKKNTDAKVLDANGAYPKQVAELRAEAEAARKSAEDLDHLLKDTPGAYAQGLTLTCSFHKSFSIAQHALPKKEAEELLKVMERTNQRLLESAGKKYGRARVSKTTEREVVGPDGVVRTEMVEEVEYHQIKGFTSATFFHTDARNVKGDDGSPPDPSSHYHNELMKDVETLDGKTASLDQGYLLDNMKAIGAEGQAILAEEAKKAGFQVEFYVSEKGERTIGIAGFSDGLIEENSKRGASIKSEKAKGLDDQKAWASSRGGKNYDPATLAGIWRKKFSDLKFMKDGKVEQRRERLPAKLEDKTYAYASDEEIIRRLTEKEAHFSEGDIRREVYFAAAEAASVGDFNALKEADARIERISTSQDLRLVDADFLSALTGRDAKGEAHFYSKNMLREELANLRTFERMSKEWTHTLPEEKARKIIAEIEKAKSKELGVDFKFRDDQIDTIIAATDGRKFTLISAKAGTGKTTSLSASIEILEKQGRKVILASSWNKAASQISADTNKLRGREVFTIAQLKGLVEKGQVKLDRDTSLMIDEAGLASHTEITWLREAAEEYGCSVLLQGDESQTAAVSTGKPFRRMVESGLVEVKSLTVITRQRDAEQKMATLAASRGDFAAAVDVYRKAGMVQDKFATRDAMVEKVATDYLACSDPLNQKICVTTKNADVGALNASIRARLVEEGKLGKNRAFVSAKGERKVELAEGERVCLTARLEKNETITNALIRHAKQALRRATKLRLDTRVKKERVGEKSEFGTVTKITGDGFYLRMDGQKKDFFIKNNEVPDVAYGYAATTSKLQGSTVESAFYMHSSFSNAALAYVSMSRHKKACHIYATEEESRSMVSDMGRKELKLDALDLLPPEEADRIRANLGMPLAEAKEKLAEVQAKADDALARASVDGALGAAEKTLSETAGRVKNIEQAIRKIEETAKEREAEKTTAQLESERREYEQVRAFADRWIAENGTGASVFDPPAEQTEESEGFFFGAAGRFEPLCAMPERAMDDSARQGADLPLREDAENDVGGGERLESDRVQPLLPVAGAGDGDVGGSGDDGNAGGGADADSRTITSEAVPAGPSALPEVSEAIRDAVGGEKKGEPTPRATASGEFQAKDEATAKAEPIRAAKPTGEAATDATATPMATADGERKKAEATAKAEPLGAKPTGKAPNANPAPRATAGGVPEKAEATAKAERLDKLCNALDRVHPSLMKRTLETLKAQKAEGDDGTDVKKLGACAIRSKNDMVARGIILGDGTVLLVEQSRTAKGGVDYEAAKLRVVALSRDVLNGKEVGKTVTLAFDESGTAREITPPQAVSKVYSPARGQVDWTKLDVSEKDTFGMTAAHHAAARGDEETLNKLLAIGGDPGRDLLGRSVASLGGRNEPVEKREPEKAAQTNASAPVSAVWDEEARAEKPQESDEWKRLRVENELLRRNLELDREARRQAEAREATVLLLNTPESDGALIRGLLEKGASVNECIKAGYGPTALLAHAPDSLPTKDLLLLLDAGANPNARDDKGNTPLHRATVMHVCEVLIERGADLEAKNAEGKTPADKAAENGREHAMFLQAYEKSIRAEKVAAAAVPAVTPPSATGKGKAK